MYKQRGQRRSEEERGKERPVNASETVLNNAENYTELAGQRKEMK